MCMMSNTTNDVKFEEIITPPGKKIFIYLRVFLLKNNSQTKHSFM